MDNGLAVSSCLILTRFRSHCLPLYFPIGKWTFSFRYSVSEGDATTVLLGLYASGHAVSSGLLIAWPIPDIFIINLFLYNRLSSNEDAWAIHLNFGITRWWTCCGPLCLWLLHPTDSHSELAKTWAFSTPGGAGWFNEAFMWMLSGSTEKDNLCGWTQLSLFVGGTLV